MTISSTTRRWEYSGNGSTTAFAYTTRITDDDHLEVILYSSGGTATVQTKTTHYTVSNVGQESGGNVTMVTAPASGETLVIHIKVPVTQPTRLRNQSSFHPETHEEVLDYQTRIDQQQQKEIDSSFRLNDIDIGSDFDMKIPTTMVGSTASIVPVTNSTSNGWADPSTWPTGAEISSAATHASSAAASAAAAASSAGISNAYGINNVGLSTSVAASAMTITMTQSDGSALGTDENQASIYFRSATSATGTVTQRSVTSAITIVIPSGATLGHTSGINEYIYVYVLDNAGTVELCVSGSDHWDEGVTHDTLSIGTGSDYETSLYSTTARSGVGIRYIGRLLVVQDTAGTWDSNSTEIHVGFLQKGKIKPAYQVVSGRKHSGHNGARYLLHDGTGLDTEIKSGGSNPDLVCVINGRKVVFTSDIAVSSLTAAPSSNNTVTVNDSNYSDQGLTKLVGEQRVTVNNLRRALQLDVDNIGTEISSRAGEWHFFSINNGTTTEVFFAFIDASGAILRNMVRGFGYNSSETDEARIVFSNNDTITLLMGNWIFVDEAGTGYSSATAPVWDTTAPSSPSSGDYWFDIANDTWKSYNGTSWDERSDRILLGVTICDSSNGTISWSWPFYFVPDDHLNMGITKFDAANARTWSRKGPSVSVFGNMITRYVGHFNWDMAGDLDTGVTEAASTIYYLYVTDDGVEKISDVYPRTKNWMAGEYHPHKPWRCVGYLFNDASSNIESAASFTKAERLRVHTTNGRGSTATARLRFTTADFQEGPGVVYTDSATNGANFTCYRTGTYSVIYSIPNNVTSNEIQGGITMNGYTNTQEPAGYDADLLSSAFYPASTTTTNHAAVSWSGILYIGDILYAQCSTENPDTTTTAYFDVNKIKDFSEMEGEEQ